MVTEEDVSRIRVKFLIEGLGEAEGELVRFMAPRTVGRTRGSLQTRNLF